MTFFHSFIKQKNNPDCQDLLCGLGYDTTSGTIISTKEKCIKHLLYAMLHTFYERVVRNRGHNNNSQLELWNFSCSKKKKKTSPFLYSVCQVVNNGVIFYIQFIKLSIEIGPIVCNFVHLKKPALEVSFDCLYIECRNK